MENMINPTLEQVLASVVQQLASFFNTTTTAVMNGMPEFLTIFAWYYTINNIWYIPVIIIVSVIIAAFAWLVVDDISCGDFEGKISKFLKIGLFIGLGIGLFIFVKNIALCIICPEIVGGMALLEQLDYLIK